MNFELNNYLHLETRTNFFACYQMHYSSAPGYSKYLRVDQHNNLFFCRKLNLWKRNWSNLWIISRKNFKILLHFKWDNETLNSVYKWHTGIGLTAFLNSSNQLLPFDISINVKNSITDLYYIFMSAELNTCTRIPFKIPVYTAIWSWITIN